MKPVIVLLAYNAAATLERTYLELPAHLRPYAIIGDDHSTDGTRDVAIRLGIPIVTNERNLGYGGNLKRMFRHALAMSADVVVELHADNQYDAGLVGMLLELLERGYLDVVQGNRMRSRDEALDGGMHWYRYYGNRALTLFENVWFGLTLGEWHSGLKAFRSEVLAQLPLDSFADDHVFASDILMECVMRGYRVGEIPIPVRYRVESSSVSPRGLASYGVRTIGAALRRPPWRRRRYGSAALPPLASDDRAS